MKFRFLGLVLLATSTASAAEASCTEEIGQAAAARLVGQCREISPATRPPCNAANSCALIRDEIVRGCKLAGKDAPGWCKGVRS